MRCLCVDGQDFSLSAKTALRQRVAAVKTSSPTFVGFLGGPASRRPCSKPVFASALRTSSRGLSADLPKWVRSLSSSRARIGAGADGFPSSPKLVLAHYPRHRRSLL